MDLVINLRHREDVVVDRILGRRTCPECYKTFNVKHYRSDDGYHLPPIIPTGDPTTCDNPIHESPVKLIRRHDDTETVIKNRIGVYMRQTKPLLDFYREKTSTKVVDFEAKKGIADFPIMRSIIQDALDSLKNDI